MKGFTTLAVAACMVGAFYSTAALSPSNEEFADQVDTYEKRLKSDELLKVQVQAFCDRLSDSRQDSEPKCVALNRVVIDSVYGKLKGRNYGNDWCGRRKFAG
jgi:hypothetical protein